MNGKKFIVTNGNENNKVIYLVANQKVLKLVKYTDSIDYTAHNKARRELSANAFLLYDYLICHSNNWIWALSSADVEKETALKIGTYNKAVQELINMRYMIPHDIDIGSTVLDKDINHSYYFYETPPAFHSENLPKFIAKKNNKEIDPFEASEPIDEAPIVMMPEQRIFEKPIRYY